MRRCIERARRALPAYLRAHLELVATELSASDLLEKLELPMPEEPQGKTWIRWVHERRMWEVEILKVEQFINQFGRKREVWLVQDLPGDPLRIVVPLRPLDLVGLVAA